MNTQFKKGVLELCALTLLLSGDRYGYELADMLGKKMTVAEGTIYPMLKRLQNDGYFESYLRESTNGPARKYYRITQKGRERQKVLREQWDIFLQQVDSLFQEAEK
ncbi:MAG: PadR family transcriptional regulator [Oscillospiraceae bacterium]|nr:PadR family transcriptional regulator [Oscillospiraceae bacterium]